MNIAQLLNQLPGAVAQGLIWGIMAIGVYITFRILDIADLTVDGSFATGGAVAAILITSGVNPWLVTLIAMKPCKLDKAEMVEVQKRIASAKEAAKAEQA